MNLSPKSEIKLQMFVAASSIIPSVQAKASDPLSWSGALIFRAWEHGNASTHSKARSGSLHLSINQLVRAAAVYALVHHCIHWSVPELSLPLESTVLRASDPHLKYLTNRAILVLVSHLGQEAKRVRCHTCSKNSASSACRYVHLNTVMYVRTCETN